MLIDIVVNGGRVTRDITAGTRLVDLLRDDLGLTATKEACSQGDCGACTVLVGGRPVLACLMLAGRVRDEVRTAEGLAAETAALREAIAAAGGIQCGYCTPGQIVRASAFLADEAAASTAGIRSALVGNICRCTGYDGIVAGIRATSGEADVDR